LAQSGKDLDASNEAIREVFKGKAEAEIEFFKNFIAEHGAAATVVKQIAVFEALEKCKTRDFESNNAALLSGKTCVPSVSE